MHTKNPRRLRAVGLVLCLAAALLPFAGCASHVRDLVRVAIPYEPNTLDPLVSDDAWDFFVEDAVFDGLVKVGPNRELLPDLAAQVPSNANGGISKDLRTITYRLRRGVVWQDGKPFTSADVAFTYRSLISERVASPQRSLYEEISSLEAPSAYTVVVHLRRPSAAAIRQLFTGGIVPAHVLRLVSDIRRSAFNDRPVGTGPFAVRSWRRGDSIDLVANDRYFAGRPHVRNLRVMIVPASATRAALLKSGDVDVAPVRLSELASLRASPALRVVESRSDIVFVLSVNTRRPPFNRPSVRRALASAVNRDELSKSMTIMGQPAYSLMPRGSYDASPCRTQRPAGNTLLARGKHPLALTIVYDPGPIMGGMAIQLQQAWNKLGVQTTLRPLPFGVLYGTHGLVSMGRYDLSIDEFQIADPSDLLGILGKSSIPPAGLNDARYENPDVERWLDSAEATADSRVRAQLYGKVQATLCRDVPMIPLVWETSIMAVNRRVEGFTANPGSELWNVASWSVK